MPSTNNAAASSSSASASRHEPHKHEDEEIIAHPTLRTYKDDDAAELPFGDDAPVEQEHRSSNQTRGLFNRCNIMMMILLVAAIVFLCGVTGLSSAVLTSSNNMVVETFNGVPGNAKASKAPTAKATKAPGCTPNTFVSPGNPAKDGNCLNCCECPDGWDSVCSSGTALCECD